MGNLWGDMRDLVSETTEKIHLEDQAYAALEAGINSQLQAAATQKGEIQTLLAESATSKTAFSESQMQKQEEAAGIQKMHDANQAECEATMNEILFTDICGVSKVRNEVIKKHIPDIDVGNVVDCEVGDWVPGECSVPCDDEFVGGTQTMKRDIITKNTEDASECPALSMVKVCNQKVCPVDCQLGDWGSYGACTKECGGGVQSRSRQLLVKPKHLGKACDALQESRPCNTGRCDADCKLGDWNAYGKCNQVCDNGLATRTKKMLVPTLRKGYCPKEESAERTNRKPCKPEACTGDEICYGKIDLVLALDASGSITEKGFDILKNFAARLVKRMVPTAYGRDAVRVGVVMFGNGKLDKNRVVSDAVAVTQPTDDMEAAEKSILGLKWQKGFTNMAQAFTKAKKKCCRRRDGRLQKALWF